MMEERRQTQLPAPHPAPVAPLNMDDSDDPPIPDSFSRASRGITLGHDRGRRRDHTQTEQGDRDVHPVPPYTVSSVTRITRRCSKLISEHAPEPSTSRQFYMSGGSTENMFAGYNAGLGYGQTGVGHFGQSDSFGAVVQNPNVNAPTQDDVDPQQFLASGPWRGRLQAPHERMHRGCGTGSDDIGVKMKMTADNEMG